MSITKATLKEKNAKLIQKLLIESKDVKELRDFMMRKYKVDPVTDTEKFPFAEGRVSLKKLEQKLMEADSSAGFGQFLRAGLQQIVNGSYQSVETTWGDWATAVSSNKDTELYAPNHGVGFVREVGANEVYPQVGAAALDLELKNKKYGHIFSVTEELLADDQSGTFAQQAGLMGEYCALVAEVLTYAKLASVSGMQYIDLQIPTSETKPSYESAYPWSTALRGGGATKPSSYGALTQGNIQAGITALLNQKNLQGIKMQVRPKRLIVGPAKEFDASVLLNSAYYPSGAAAAGNVGGAFAINPIKGLLDLTVSRFVFKQDGTVNGDSTAWYIVDDSKPFFVVQMREPVAVVQEATNAGQGFEKDVVRFKGRTRLNADFIDPRFAWQGSDGSV